MERAYGRSFGGVRIHTDAGASDLARDTGAEAVTLGDRIAFGTGQFRPGTASGDHLIAHELAHVAQQGSGGPTAHGRGIASEAHEPAERQAEAAAHTVMRGGRVNIVPGAAGGGFRARLLRRARMGAGALPSFSTATPVPGSGVLGGTVRNAPNPAIRAPTAAVSMGEPVTMTGRSARRAGSGAGMRSLAAQATVAPGRVAPATTPAERTRSRPTASRKAGPDEAQTAQTPSPPSPPSAMVAGASAGASAATAALTATEGAPAASGLGGPKKEKDGAKGKGKDKDRGRERQDGGAGGGEGGPGLAGGGGRRARRRRTRGRGRFGDVPGDRGEAAALRALGRVERRTVAQQHHEAPGKPVDGAQAHAKLPPNKPEADAQGAQVNAVASWKPAPPDPDPKAVRGELDSAIKAAAPKNLEELDDMEGDGRVSAITTRVKGEVDRQVNGVTTTLDRVNRPDAPAKLPAPPGQPDLESAPRTARPRLAAATPPAVPDESLDATEFLDDPDAALKEQGIDQQTLDRAQDGPLAEIAGDRKELGRNVDNAARDVRGVESPALTEAENELTAVEESGNAEMAATRSAIHKKVGGEQDNVRGQKETGHQTAADKIQGIYTTTADYVNERLGKLSGEQLTKFDTLQTKFLEGFKKDVNTELDAWKDDRYGGWFGWTRWPKDKLLGINHLEGVKYIYDSNREAYEFGIRLITKDITDETKAVIDECKKKLEDAKKEIQDLIDELPRAEKRDAIAAQKQVAMQFRQLENRIEREAINVANGLKDRRRKAIEAVDKALEEIKSANEGLVNKIVNAVKALIDFLGKFLRLMGRIVRMGIGTFLGNALSQAKDGIRFHLWDALKQAFKDWLFQQLPFLEPLMNLPPNWTEMLVNFAMGLPDMLLSILPAVMPQIALTAMGWLATQLAAKLIPGIGAIMAVIDALKAAWNLIQSLLSAASAFFAFLMLVAEPGNGAKQFAVALARGIVGALQAILTFLGVDSLIIKLGGVIARPFANLFKKLAARVKSRRNHRRETRHAERRRERERDGGRDEPSSRGPRQRAHSESRGERRRERDATQRRRREPAPTRGRTDRKAPKRDPRQHREQEKNRRKQDKERRNRERMARAERDLPPRIRGMLNRRSRSLLFRARMAFWRARYRLRLLEMRQSGHNVRFVAANSPLKELALGFTLSEPELLRMLKRIAEEFWDRHIRTKAKSKEGSEQAKANRDAAGADLDRMRSAAATTAGGPVPEGTFQPTRPLDDLRLAKDNQFKPREQNVIHAEEPSVGPTVRKPSAQTRQQAGGGRFTKPVDPISGQEVSDNLSYDKLVEALTKDRRHTPAEVGGALNSMRSGAGIPPAFTDQAKELSLLRTVLFNVEVQRDRRNLLFSPMAVDLMTRGHSPQSVLSQTPEKGLHPATPTGASAVGFKEKGGRVPPQLWRKAEGKTDQEKIEATAADLRKENRDRQVKMFVAWFKAQDAAGGVPVCNSLADLERFVLEWVERQYGLSTIQPTAE